MSGEFLLILGLFLVGLAVFLFISNLIAGDESAKPLMWAEADKPKEKSGLIRVCRPFVHRFTVPIVRRYGFKNYREEVKRKLVSAGMKDQLNDEEFVGFQIFLGLFAPAVIAMANALFNIGYPWWLIMAFAVFGFYALPMQVKAGIEKRRAQVGADLPFVIDLLALSIEAGSDFLQALQKVVDRMNGGALSEELQQVLRDLTLGSSRAEALNAMAYRLNMSQVTSFIAVLVTADATGSPIGPVLRQQSETMRQERFTRAEKLGAEASQKVFIPLVLFILPAVFIVLFGPVILQFMGVK